MSARQIFWGSPEKWPNDSASYIFLARAILALGKSMYGVEWTNSDVTVEDVRLSSINLLDDVYLNNFLATHEPNSERKIVGRVGSGSFKRIHANGLVEDAHVPEHPVSITVDDRISALSLVEKLKSQNAPAIRRAAQVQNEFIKLAESEKLLTAYRDINGGDQVVIPRVWWNAEMIQNRFSNCQIEPAAPFNNQETGSAWIYVSRASLGLAVSDRAPHDCGSQFVKTLNAKGQGGRPPEYDWDEIKMFAKSQVDKHGKPGRGNRKLPRQEDLVNLILKEWAARDLHPSASNVRKYLSKWLGEF